MAGAIEGVGIASVRTSRDRKPRDTRETPRGLRLHTRLRRRPYQRDQVLRLAADQRQFQNLCVRDDFADTCGAGFHHRGVGLHFHGLGYLTYFQHGVDDACGIDLQDDSALNERPESHQRRLNSIWANRQVRQNVSAAFIAENLPADTGGRLRRGYFCARNECPARVADRPVDLCGRLTPCRCTTEYANEQCTKEISHFHRKLLLRPQRTRTMAMHLRPLSQSMRTPRS